MSALSSEKKRVCSSDFYNLSTLTRLTVKEPPHVKYLDDSIPVEFIRHGAVLRAHIPRADPEDATLAQPFNEDALLVGTDQHTSLQVAEQLARDLARPFVFNELSGREVNALHAV